MLNYLIYGKIIIDDIQLTDGRVARNILGGGGPQAAFGARLWSDSVGFLSRSGTDLEVEHRQTLRDLDIDLSGWQEYPDIPTTRNLLLNYDENGYMVFDDGKPLERAMDRENWFRLLAQVLPLPPHYQQPRVIHLITEFADEPMVETALHLRRAQGAIFSLEPIIDFAQWTNRDSILALLPQVDIATPDWPSASGMAGSDDPKEVLAYWSKLGPRMVAVRDGARGSYVWDRDHNEMWHVPPARVEVVDPTGAGNSYGGGLCVGWAKTQEARLAGCYGAVSAKFLVERVGLPKMSASLQTEAQSVLAETVATVKRL